MHLAEEMVAPRPGVRFQKRARKWLAGTKMQAQKCDRFLTLFFEFSTPKSDYRFSFFLRSHSIQQHSSLSCCRFGQRQQHYSVA